MTDATANTMTGPRGAKPKRVFSSTNIMIYGTLLIVCMYYLLPLYVMIVTSLKGMPEIRLGNIFSPPVEVTFQPWVKAWAEACTGVNCDGLSRGFWNSVQILVPSVVVSIAVASVSGYALVNWRFKGSETFFTILIFGAFIPYQVMIYPIVIILRETGGFLGIQLMGSIWGLVIVHTIFGMPILTLLFRNYFSSVPEELFKAARVDGAGFWGIYFKIMLPMSLPIFVVAMILQVTGIWHDFLFGVIYTKPPTSHPQACHTEPHAAKGTPTTACLESSQEAGLLFVDCVHHLGFVISECPCVEENQSLVDIMSLLCRTTK